MTIDDGTCQYPPLPSPGCTDPYATNYNPQAGWNDGSCKYTNEFALFGCMDPNATNYDPSASQDNGKCTYKDVVVSPEVFYGSFSGPFGGSSSFGTTYAYYLDGDITLTLVKDTDNSISGTAEVPTYVDMTIVSSQAPVTANPFSVVATGEVEVNGNNLTGVFANDHIRPLTMEFTCTRSGDTITCKIVFTKTFLSTYTSGDGSYSEDFPTVTATISNIILTKK